MHYGQNTQEVQDKLKNSRKATDSVSGNGSKSQEDQLSFPDLNSSQFPDSINPGDIGNAALKSAEASSNGTQEIPDSMMPNADHPPETVPDITKNPVFDSNREVKEESNNNESLGQIIELKTPQPNEHIPTSGTGDGGGQKKTEQTRIAKLQSQIDDFMRNAEPDLIGFYDTMQEEREQDIAEGAS